jgi:hypothetical protein
MADRETCDGNSVRDHVGKACGHLGDTHAHRYNTSNAQTQDGSAIIHDAAFVRLSTHDTQHPTSSPGRYPLPSLLLSLPS